MIHGHGGNIYEVARRFDCRPSEIIDMSSNINPLGPPPGLLQHLKENLEAITRLPEVDAGSTVRRFAEFIGVESERLLAGNGTTQFIYAIPQVLESARVLIVGPTYTDYGDACRLQGVPHIFYMTKESEDFIPDIEAIEQDLQPADTIFICNPNNPTGTLIPAADLKSLCRCYPKKNFIIDESYLDFVPHAANETMVHAGLDNVIVLLSVSKIFKIPGLRTGFITGAAAGIEKFRTHLLPWSTNSLAQLAMDYIAEHKAMIQEFIDETRRYISSQRQQFCNTMEKTADLRIYNGQASFILLKLQGELSANDVWQKMAEDKILIRSCANVQGLSDRFIRISLKTPEANRLMASRLLAIDRGAEKSRGGLTALRMAS